MTRRIKRNRSSQTSSAELSQPIDHTRNVYLPEFKVLARLVAYNQLRGTGVRLPSEGLAVTGPLWEAMQTIPSAAAAEDLTRADDWVIATCENRNDTGVRFLPEGLKRFGLCLPTVEPERVLAEWEEEEVEHILTPIGRAAVEMVWAGAMAVTSFGASA